MESLWATWCLLHLLTYPDSVKVVWVCVGKGRGCVPVTPFLGSWMRGLVRPRQSSTAVASLLTLLCTSPPSPAPPWVSLGTPCFCRHHLLLLLTAPAAPTPLACLSIHTSSSTCHPDCSAHAGHSSEILVLLWAVTCGSL